MVLSSFFVSFLLFFRITGRGLAGVRGLEGGEDVEGHWLLGNRKGR